MEEQDKQKKLISGRCSKPDETDILKVVKYAHEKLDPKHVRNRKMEHLDFNILIAGELEIACLPEIEEEERIARVRIAKTLCYHRNYLETSDLRAGYEDVLKEIEMGKADWKDDIEDKLHNLLDYRANVLARERITKQQTDGFTRVENRRDKNKQGANEGKHDRIVYCLEYNLGQCPQTDHHERRFNNKRSTKFHICRRCYKDGEHRSHRDTDDICPKKHS